MWKHYRYSTACGHCCCPLISPSKPASPTLGNGDLCLAMGYKEGGLPLPSRTPAGRTQLIPTELKYGGWDNCMICAHDEKLFQCQLLPWISPSVAKSPVYVEPVAWRVGRDRVLEYQLLHASRGFSKSSPCHKQLFWFILF